MTTVLRNTLHKHEVILAHI